MLACSIVREARTEDWGLGPASSLEWKTMRITRRDAITRMAMAAVAAAVPPLQPPPLRRQITVGGRRVRTVDAHAHTFVPAAAAAVSGTELEKSVAGSLQGNLVMSDERLRAMDAQGIDVEVLSINPYWYSADRAV